tara:strand:- start:154 stop:1788 length:1635 start_codon:yes stop_codon:yes gene_type:complete
MVSFKVFYEANIANADAVKSEIVSLMNSASRTKPNLEPGGAIYKWFTNSLMKFLTGPATSVSFPFQQSLIGLEPHNYKEGEPEWMAKDGVVDFTDVGNWPKMEHIIDYFNSLSDRDREKIVKKPYEQVDKEVEQWDKDLAAQEKSSEGRLKEDADYEVLYKDGEYTWVKLKTKAAYECEGEGMGHCVGGYDPDNDNNTIISLWDKKGEPHVTIEIQEYGGNPGNPYPDDIEEMVQIKGKQNDAPVGKYKEIAAKFVKKWLDGGTYNKQAKSLKELQPDRIVTGDGKGIGMIKREASDGEWQYYFEDTKLWKWIYSMVVAPLQQYRIQFITKGIGEDENYGTILDGDMNLSYGQFREIPKEVEVRGVDGDVNLHQNLLTSLKNSPIDVEGDFYAGHNQLESLEGGPSTVDGDYKVDHNKLKNLKGLPEYIAGDLHINANPLESLEGAENTVVGGTIFVGGWPVEDAGTLTPLGQAKKNLIERDAPDFMKPDKIKAAFKKIFTKGPNSDKHKSWTGLPADGPIHYVAQSLLMYAVPEPILPKTLPD